MTKFKRDMYEIHLRPGDMITAGAFRKWRSFFEEEVTWVNFNGENLSFDRFMDECMPADPYEDDKELFVMARNWPGNGGGFCLRHLGQPFIIYLKAEQEEAA